MGKDGKYTPLDVKEGDTVLFTSWAGDNFEERGTTDELVIMAEEEILAVLDS